ncbi:hypothetical protein DHEL01_v209675 [Diaporthe helianthi]|uniref:2EXR domain-containing protein n=1 Tax=Diaporthe helianthi TaxID=158607 RepID=A0A2P5HNU9_DIAHE|nr:hypothetical protein DHEL01_v209675 [Diaporthe helianthi]
MSHEFPQFLSLPRELQLLIFEQALVVSLNPRIVLLDTQEHSLFVCDKHLVGWGWRVSNREQLEQDSPAEVANALMQVSNTGRYAANQFLDRFVLPFNPPQVSQPFLGLGLCLIHDVFWLPDDLDEFLITTIGPPADPDPVDEENMSNLMISLEPFQEALEWATQSGYEFSEPVGYRQFLKSVLINIIDTFPSAWDLIVMVDVPRGQHISWDQIQVVRGSDPDLSRIQGGGDGSCHSLYQTYEALSQKLVSEDPARDRARALPELSFAFRRAVQSPPRLTIS